MLVDPTTWLGIVLTVTTAGFTMLIPEARRVFTPKLWNILLEQQRGYTSSQIRPEDSISKLPQDSVLSCLSSVVSDAEAKEGDMR